MTRIKSFYVFGDQFITKGKDQNGYLFGYPLLFPLLSIFDQDGFVEEIAIIVMEQMVIGHILVK